MRKKILFLMLVMVSVFLFSISVYATTPPVKDSTYVLRYGCSVEITEGGATLQSSNTNIAQVKDQTISIVGTGRAKITVTGGNGSKVIDIFAWNTYLTNDKDFVYTDASKTTKSAILYSKVYLATSEENGALKINDYISYSSSNSGSIIGKYLSSYYTADKSRSTNSNYIYSMQPSSLKYDIVLNSLGLTSDEKIWSEREAVRQAQPTQQTSNPVVYNPSSTNYTTSSATTTNMKNVDISSGRINATQAGQIIANCASYLVANRKSEFVYSYGLNHVYKGGREQAYKGVKVNGYAYGTYNHYNQRTFRFTNKYSVDCIGFVNVCIRWSLKIGNESYTRFSAGKAGFEKLATYPKTLTKSNCDQFLKPGDIIHYNGHYALYLGDQRIAEAVNYGTPDPSRWTIHNRSISVWKSREVKGIIRITEEGAAAIDVNSIDKIYLSGS